MLREETASVEVGLYRGRSSGPECSSVESVADGQTGVESVLDTQPLERRDHGDQAGNGDVVPEFEQDVEQALGELHLVGEGRDGGRQEGRRARVGVEVAEPGGDE